MKKYDVLVIGAGLAGIFTAMELIRTQPDLKIALIEQGEPIAKRNCPIIAGQASSCIHCDTCDIMRGFGGAGAFSDGKFNFTTEFGGWLTDYLPAKEVMDLIYEVDKINREFGAPEDFYSTETPKAEEVRRRALGCDIHLLDAKCKHIGTERNREILLRQYSLLENKINIYCRTKVVNINPVNNGLTAATNGLGGYILETTAGDFQGKFLVAAPGRAGAEWFSHQAKELGLSMTHNQVDLGVRVELPALVFKDITDAMYEAKLKYETRQYHDIVRTFCMNPYGHVVTENTDGIITVNGHSYENPELRSENTNFALLVSNRFTQPFREPNRYGKHIAALSNMLGGGVLMQRFGDLTYGRRTTEHRMSKCFVRPTLDAVPGDLSLVLPKRHLDNVIEMIYALDKLAPGTANADTLLYGVEVKFYSGRAKLTPELETELPNFFAIGDGAGITRGLSQAGATGIHVARVILNRLS
ncbi:MAG TPA: NAD(P)/FAD-dependent oxidoreductase [Clostridiaceae bacterium]|nr:NAD(P)/FAD-dependent oxidoreductase [Clostridiaceae bacterium]